MTSIGTRFGPYEIVASLGAGGMGEVYRAHDSRLARDVAIKILPASMTFDPERRARFEREARTLASLSHPNIGAIYGLEDLPAPSPDGARALVLELIEGETLEQICASPDRAPLTDVLSIARQLTDALEAAHERGITHRDLKPANIKVTPGGVLKVLDFGLAKPSPDGSGSESSGADITIANATQSGVVVGTPAYMSPEQARGLAVDRRADIWAFGCVLFELLSGTLPFRRDTLTGTLAAVLEDDPDWSRLASAPPSLRRLVRRCLVKDPRRRLRDIGDARFELDEAESGVEPAGVPASKARAVVFQRLTASTGLNESPAISPDGKMIAFVADSGGCRQIWMLLLAGGPPLQITHDEVDHLQPRWSPDSSSLIYFTPPARHGDEGTIWEISALGGPARPVASAQGPGDVSHDGARIALLRTNAGTTELVTIDRDGGSLRSVVVVADGDGCGWPRWSPDDRCIAFHSVVITHFDERLLVADVADGTSRGVARATLIRGLSWLPDGSLLYASATAATLPYPPTCNLRTVGRDGSNDRPVTYGDLSYVEPDVHRSGRIVVSRLRIQSDLWRIPVAGSPQENTRRAVRVTRQTGQVQTPATSPDGREVVYLADHGGHSNLWVTRADGGPARQITFERDPAVGIGVPAWSPDGRHILYLVSRGHTELWITTPHGRGHRCLVDRGFAGEWSADGNWVYYIPIASSSTRTIDKVNLSSGEVVRVRSGGVHGPVANRDALFFAARVDRAPGAWHWEIRRASPDDAPSEAICEVPAARMPHSPMFVHPRPSPDGTRLALPMLDGPTTNVWIVPLDGNPMRPATDFSDNPVLIVRRIDWSADSTAIYAALAERNADVILLDGLI